MSWFPIDDAFHSHPKVRRAGLEAIGLWTVAGSYCMAYLTDGHVPEWFVREKPRGVKLAKLLVDAGLWKPGVNTDNEPGWWFHDWKPECTKAHIESVRENARQRKAKSRESHRLSHVTDGVTHAGRDVGVLGYPTQPNPTQPSIPVETSGGEGPEAIPPEHPRPHCPTHPDGNADAPCRRCQSRRRWDEHHAATVEADELESRRAARAAATAARDGCPSCDDGGWVCDTAGIPLEPAVRCDHQQETCHA